MVETPQDTRFRILRIVLNRTGQTLDRLIKLPRLAKRRTLIEPRRRGFGQQLNAWSQRATLS